MPWRLIVTRPAEKDLADLPGPDKLAVLAALERLVNNPGTADLRKLTGRPNEWRLRVGRWRVLLWEVTPDGSDSPIYVPAKPEEIPAARG